jgi:hypothetical protein
MVTTSSIDYSFASQPFPLQSLAKWLSGTVYDSVAIEQY